VDSKYGPKSLIGARIFRDEHEALRRSACHGQAAEWWNAMQQHRLWYQAATNVSNTMAASFQAVPKTDHMEECPSMDAAIQESFETITIKQDPEDSKNIGSIYWDDWWCGVDVGILYMNNRPVGKP
jgi:hypothetical protein